MANTIIRLKKSSVASHLPDPGQLEYGEIALNYADGKIFYKDASGNVQQISGSANSFSTVSANGTYLIATSPTNILTINPGNNIEIQGDFITDSFTIAANLKAAYDIANAAFDRANSSNDVLYVAAAYDTANAAYNAANSAGSSQSINLIFSTANSGYDTANAAFNTANSIIIGLEYPTGDYGSGEPFLQQNVDAFGVSILQIMFDCHKAGPLSSVDLGPL